MANNKNRKIKIAGYARRVFFNDNIEYRNAKKISIKTIKKIKFDLLYDSNRSLQKKIKIEQLRKETI